MAATPRPETNPVVLVPLATFPESPVQKAPSCGPSGCAWPREDRTDEA